MRGTGPGEVTGTRSTWLSRIALVVAATLLAALTLAVLLVLATWTAGAATRDVAADLSSPGADGWSRPDVAGPDGGKTPARPATPAEVAGISGYCGAGYFWIDTYDMRRESDGAVRGHYLLGYNGTRNCGVAECYLNCGTTMNRVAAIRVSGHLGWDDVDGGNFKYFAGPVYSDPSAGRCIDLRGYFQNLTGDPNTISVLRFGVHCG